MNKRIWPRALLLIVGMGISVHAQNQTSREAPPSPPYLNPIPDNTQWLITVTVAPTSSQPSPETSGAPPKPPTLKSQSITITGDIRRDVFTWDNGIRTETWFYKGATLREYIGTMQIYLDDEHVNMDNDVPAPSTWDKLGWLASTNYVQRTVEQGISCYEFRMGEGDSSLRVLIDVKTHFPILLQENGSIYHYEKQDAPPQKLTLPPQFAAKWNQYMATIKKLSSNRPAR